MDKNFTRFLHYYQIDTSAVDIYSDAFGYDYILQELISGFKKPDQEPGDVIIRKIMTEADRFND